MTKSEIAIKVKNEMVRQDPRLASEKFRRSMSATDKRILVARMVMRATMLLNFG